MRVVLDTNLVVSAFVSEDNHLLNLAVYHQIPIWTMARLIEHLMQDSPE